MPRTGRELTLSGIYGSPDGPRATTAKKSKAPSRPNRPLPIKPPYRRLKEAEAIEPALTTTSSTPGNGEKGDSLRASLAVHDHRVERDGATKKNAETATTNPPLELKGTNDKHCIPAASPAPAPLPSPPRLRCDGERRARPTIVMSLYGDGFIEMAPRCENTSDVDVPFTMRFTVFKAADEMKDKNTVESDASRHLSPELNDDGEFIRWSCCGSPDKSVYGCPVASTHHPHDLSVDELLKLHTPKLLACKLTRAEDAKSLQFVVFDRGLPSGLTLSDTGAVNAGCRISWRGYECWATAYEIPHGRWVDFTVSFDGRYLRLLIDDELVDTAVVQPRSRAVVPLCRCSCVLGCSCLGSQWAATAGSSTKSVYIGGYAKYSRNLTEWRARAGFVGLIGDVLINDVAHLFPVDVGEVKDICPSSRHTVVIHRNVFWRKVFPPFLIASKFQDGGVVRLLANFYHGAHNDLSLRSAKSFENLLLSIVQVGDVRVRINYAVNEYNTICGGSGDHGCRTQSEYATKCHEFIRSIEQLSPLLVVTVNLHATGEGSREPCAGSFEVSIELCRSPGSPTVSILLHSMLVTACFPGHKEIKAKIVDVITHESRRSPGEEVIHQAFRHFLSLADQGRDSRERSFMESVMNRKGVITEKRMIAVFERIGFYFAQNELQEMVSLFKTMQDNVLHHQHRMDDIPTMSLLSPTPNGMYRLPLVHRVSLNAITPSDRTATKSPWRFVAALLNYDLQLLDFIHDGCPQTSCGDTSYTQLRYLRGGFVDRLSIQLSELPSHVYCVLISLKKRGGFDTHPSSTQESAEAGNVLVQLENGETLQQLAQFEIQATSSSACKWLSLAALYRSRKSKVWHFQALGGESQAASIHSSLEKMNSLLVDRHIVQVYDVLVSYQDGSAFSVFASQFSKNIRFGRNGKIVVLPRMATHQATMHHKNAQEAEEAITSRKSTGGGGASGTHERSAKLEVSLRIQGIENEISVYRHDDSVSVLPTVQSICRSILRTLADHGIKESLQQNPFVAGAKKLKRPVAIRITSDDANIPVPNAYIFIERSLDNNTAIASLASKIVPTLTMGSRLVSIRKRLQKRKYADEVKLAARRFVAETVALGIRYALVSIRDSKFVPIVRSRAVLRRAMRRRREQIKKTILEAMSESEQSRIYSRSGPVRLQQLYRHQLALSSSEKELVSELADLDLNGFRREFGLETTRPGWDPDHAHMEEAWQSQLQESRSASTSANGTATTSTSAAAAAAAAGGGGSSCQLTTPALAPQREEPPAVSGLAAGGAKKQPKRSYVTDAKGIATCRLAPGSYSLYVFHADFFEWTSLAVVFPTVNASGSFGGSLLTSAPQEIVVPLETFKWSYGIQLVDFYHQHTPKQVQDVPILITDKVTSEQIILKTHADGTVVWDVRKGIYSIRALIENTSIIYSGSKNVVVDGGRFHPPRTIFVPVLFGKVAMELVVCCSSILPFSVASTAMVHLVGEEEPTEPSPMAPSSMNGFKGPRAHACVAIEEEEETQEPLQKATSIQSMAVNSSCRFQLRPGKYTLDVSMDGCFASSSVVDAPWHTDAKDSCRRNMVVLCPIIAPGSSTYYRIMFSFVDVDDGFNAMLEVEEVQRIVRTYWRHGDETVDAQEKEDEKEDVRCHDTVTIDKCVCQSFTLRCRPGRSYFLRVASRRATGRGQLHHAQPRIQVYDASGLVLEVTATDKQVDWNKQFYWQPCHWDADGKLVKGISSSCDEREEKKEVATPSIHL